MARPLRLDEVRPPEYIEVDSLRMDRMRAKLSNWWGNQIPIAPCDNCGRYTEDPNRDAAGEPMHENPEDNDEVLCKDCLGEWVNEAVTAGIVYTINEHLDLSEEKRAKLGKLLAWVVTEPDEFLELKDLSRKVRHLESQNKLIWSVIIGGIIVLLIALASTVVALVVALAGGTTG